VRIFSIKSPYLFRVGSCGYMKEKHIKRGVRTSLENFGRYEDIDVYPLYAIGNVVRG